jgi:hypothetical protein
MADCNDCDKGCGSPNHPAVISAPKREKNRFESSSSSSSSSSDCPDFSSLVNDESKKCPSGKKGGKKGKKSHKDNKLSDLNDCHESSSSDSDSESCLSYSESESSSSSDSDSSSECSDPLSSLASDKPPQCSADSSSFETSCTDQFSSVVSDKTASCGPLKKHSKGKKFVVSFGSKAGHPWAQYNTSGTSVYVNGKNGPVLHLNRGATYFIQVEQQVRPGQPIQHSVALTNSPAGGPGSQILPGTFQPLATGTATFHVDKGFPRYSYLQDTRASFAGCLVIVHDA